MKKYIPRPERWKAGPDAELRKRRLGYYRSKSQAKFRRERWLFTEAEWLAKWPLSLWRQRGKKGFNLIMTRIDISGPWNLENTRIQPRRGNMVRHYYYKVHGRQMSEITI